MLARAHARQSRAREGALTRPTSPRAVGAIRPLFAATIIGAFLASFLVAGVGSAAVALTVSPITWDVVGLDSNKVTDGPATYPVGARVCDAGSTAATNVTATFAWDSSNAYISLVPGSLSTVTVPNLPAGASPATRTPGTPPASTTSASLRTEAWGQ
jgi:hypothetical protein